MAKLRLATLLSGLEQVLRELDWWEQHPPSTQALQSQQPFCVDTLEFAQWLQWMFIPRMQSIVTSEQALPRQCAIYEMAEVVYREQTAAVADLLVFLKDIDTTVVASRQHH